MYEKHQAFRYLISWLLINLVLLVLVSIQSIAHVHNIVLWSIILLMILGTLFISILELWLSITDRFNIFPMGDNIADFNLLMSMLLLDTNINLWSVFLLFISGYIWQSILLLAADILTWMDIHLTTYMEVGNVNLGR